MYLILILWSRLILSNSQLSATLWVLETCLIVGLPWSSWLRLHCHRKCKAWHLDEKISRLRKHDRHLSTQDHCSVRESWSLCWSVCLTNCFAAGLPALAPCASVSCRKKNEHFNNKIPEVESWNSIHAQTCVKRKDFRFRLTERNWRLFLTHPTYGTKCVTARNAQTSSRSRLWSFEISREIGVLK